MKDADVKVPLSVSGENRITYIDNFLKATQETGRLMLFAGDQKVEHLNSDFYGDGISPEDNTPEHMFKIASHGRIGAFATQMGLIASYGMDYPSIPYIVKLNAKTNLVKTEQSEPISNQWLGIDQVIDFKQNSGLNIVGVGYTLYMGSQYESEMLKEAAEIIYQAHKHGLITVLWCYPRGKAVIKESDPHLLAGAAGVAACLGADFVKLNAKTDETTPAETLQEVTRAAGRTGVICVGGSSSDAEVFLKRLYDQIHVGGTRGNATGRNIHQRSFDEAVRFCNAISAITFHDKSVEDAMKIYNEK